MMVWNLSSSPAFGIDSTVLERVANSFLMEDTSAVVVDIFTKTMVSDATTTSNTFGGCFYVFKLLVEIQIVWKLGLYYRGQIIHQSTFVVGRFGIRNLKLKFHW